MHWPLPLIIAGPFIAALNPLAAQPAPVGAYQAIAVDSPSVLEAKAAIQKYFARLKLGEVQRAWSQVVAGTNFKLVVLASGDDGPPTWEFVAWHRLNGEWQLTSAQRL